MEYNPPKLEDIRLKVPNGYYTVQVWDNQYIISYTQSGDPYTQYYNKSPYNTIDITREILALYNKTLYEYQDKYYADLLKEVANEP